jgi:flagellar biosynthesis protein FlhF
MKIKKFTARTFSEALTLVKKELSRDAVILSTEEKKGLRPHVEVTAAVDYEAAEGSIQSSGFSVQRDAMNSKREAQNQKHTVQNPKLEPPLPARTPTPYHAMGNCDDGVAELRTEISSLRSMLESMKNNGYEVSLPVKKRAVLNYLRERSISELFALRLCDKTRDLSDIPLLLSADIKVKRNDLTRKAVMMIGPTGVGKTTTIAKLSAQAVKAGKKAAIINLDTYRIGAMEQVRIYARILGIPLASATNSAEFKDCLQKFTAERDVVFIDTMGKNPRDEAYIADIAGFCSLDIPIELHLLMSAGADDESMIEAYRSYRRLPIDYLDFSKVDEAVRFGSLYNLLLTYQKPVAWLTTGQRVPGDIEQATVKRLASLIMTKECPVC